MTEQAQKDRIVVIDANAGERSMLVETTLPSFGYEVQAADSGGPGLSMIFERKPDVVILDLHLDGLTGSDVMAALNAQAVDVPVICIANRGQERALLEAFRLGAKDYLWRPIREAEVIQAVENALKEVRLKRERATLVGEVRSVAESSEKHLRELRTLMGIGRSVTAIRDLNEIFDRVIRTALQLTRAETIGLYLVNDQGQLMVQNGHNMSRNLIERLGEPVSDDLASLVMNSRETYVASGAGLAKFRPAQEGAQSVIYSPMSFQDRAIGVLWAANSRLEFEPHMRDIVAALADYAGIAVSNARLFHEMQACAKQAETLREQLQAEQAAFEEQSAARGAVVEGGGGSINMITDMRRPLTELLGNMNLFRTGEMGQLGPGQQAAVDVMHRQLESLVKRIDELFPPAAPG